MYGRNRSGREPPQRGAPKASGGLELELEAKQQPIGWKPDDIGLFRFCGRADARGDLHLGFRKSRLGRRRLLDPIRVWDIGPRSADDDLISGRSARLASRRSRNDLFGGSRADRLKREEQKQRHLFPRPLHHRGQQRPARNDLISSSSRHQQPKRIPNPGLGGRTNASGKRCSVVPLYFFHLHNDVDAPDSEGLDLDNLESARKFAHRQVRFTAAETIKEAGHFIGAHRIDIEDEDGTVLDTVYFRDAVKVEA